MATRLFRNGNIWYRVIDGKAVKADDITKRMEELKERRYETRFSIYSQRSRN